MASVCPISRAPPLLVAEYGCALYHTHGQFLLFALGVTDLTPAMLALKRERFCVFFLATQGEPLKMVMTNTDQTGAQLNCVDVNYEVVAST